MSCGAIAAALAMWPLLLRGCFKQERLELLSPANFLCSLNRGTADMVLAK
jgi:hypothetical protein